MNIRTRIVSAVNVVQTEKKTVNPGGRRPDHGDNGDTENESGGGFRGAFENIPDEFVKNNGGDIVKLLKEIFAGNV